MFPYVVEMGFHAEQKTGLIYFNQFGTAQTTQHWVAKTTPHPGKAN